MKFTKLFPIGINPRAKDEDTRRREFVLNILLLASITLLAIAMASSVLTSLTASIESRSNNAMPLLALLAILLFFCGLYLLSRRGYAVFSSFVLTGIFCALSLYLALRWGPDLPSAMLFYALTITVSGIILGSRSAFFVTAGLCLSVLLIHHLSHVGYLSINGYWRSEALMYGDVTVIAVMLAIISTVAWLGNRETERSLIRARRSEAELKEERDNLEVRVIERTEELRKAELERMSQAYKFVEFGRLASSIFHDLGNPLTALSLNIESIARGASDRRKLELIADDIDRARSATEHMQKLMGSMRRHLAREGDLETFSLGKAATEAVHVLSSYARARNVTLRCEGDDAGNQYGDPVAFMQILTNIVSNAIESFPQSTGSRANRIVTISLAEEPGQTVMTIRDTGPGMPPETLERVFEPFFSTKGETGGLGIGLPLAKRVLEKNFGGTVSVASVLGEGTVFTLYFPVREP